jgi:hypothetical protein
VSLDAFATTVMRGFSLATLAAIIHWNNSRFDLSVLTCLTCIRIITVMRGFSLATLASIIHWNNSTVDLSVFTCIRTNSISWLSARYARGYNYNISVVDLQ